MFKFSNFGGAMKFLVLVLTIGMLSLPAFADGVSVMPVEMAAGFETANGKLVIAGEQVVFLDETSPEFSFWIARDQVESVTDSSGTLVVTLKEPIRDRQGQRTRLAFRYAPGTTPQAMMAWFDNQARTSTSSASVATTPGAGTAATSVGKADMSYEVRHKRLFGDTNGKLVVTDQLIRYECTDKIEDSRNWALRQVKEVKLKNPYELQIIPFTGDKYEFVVKGTPITGDDFKQITDRIVEARTQSSR
jgi:hypothetical protein